MEIMKKLFTIIICICAMTAQAQKPNNEALRKLQMAEFAITNLYVDKVMKTSWWKKPSSRCWHNSTRTPPTTMPKK